MVMTGGWFMTLLYQQYPVLGQGNTDPSAAQQPQESDNGDNGTGLILPRTASSRGNVNKK